LKILNFKITSYNNNANSLGTVDHRKCINRKNRITHNLKRKNRKTKQ